jgi:hypothetical protein
MLAARNLVASAARSVVVSRSVSRSVVTRGLCTIKIIFEDEDGDRTGTLIMDIMRKLSIALTEVEAAIGETMIDIAHENDIEIEGTNKLLRPI